MVDFDKDRDANLATFERTGGAAHGGLTVRDYFAIKVLASHHAPELSLLTRPNGENVIEQWPIEWAYKVADVMMKERNKPVQQPTPSVEEAFGLNK